MTGERPLAVFDVDGVLADVRHRLGHLQGRRRDWDAFFAAAVDDPPLEEGVRLAQEADRDCEVVYVTGRPGRCRTDTVAWLARHGLPAGELRMRADGDRRPARVAKHQLLGQLAAGRLVAVVVDDDAAVCEAYAGAGWPVLHAGWMAAPPALEQAQQSEGRT